jgi:hypothetical protein
LKVNHLGGHIRKDDRKILVYYIIFASLGLLAAVSVFLLNHNIAPFFDEVELNIPAAKNFFLHGRYALFSVGYNSEITSGLWCTFPSGIAAAYFNAPLPVIRTVCYVFNSLLLFIAARLGLNQLKELSNVKKNLLAVTLVGLFFSLVPYPPGFFLTLGEVPAGGYFGIGLALLSQSILLGFFFIGVAVYGGKTVYTAFAIPLLLTHFLANNRGTYFSRIKPLWALLLPQILWIMLIFVTLGIQGALDWFRQLYNMFLFYTQAASGSGRFAHATQVTFFDRLSKLEWASYSVSLKLKIILLLMLPTILTFLSFRKDIQRSGLIGWIKKHPILPALNVGLWIFTIWYFTIHPFMWARHVQPALIVGFGVIVWYGLKSFYDTQSPRWSKAVLLSLVLLAFGKDIYRILNSWQ